jgi:hypothetical protein
VSAPAHSSPAGYEAPALDDAIRAGIAAANANARHCEALGKRVEDALKNLESHKLGAAPLEEANALTTLHDRMAKANLNTVKALDELSRLRSFVAGGPDSRPDITARGEHELRKMILQALVQLGLRAIDAKGDVIDVEAYPA